MTSQTLILTLLAFRITIQIPYELLLKLATVAIILIATWLVWIIGVLIGLFQLGLELNVLLVILALSAVTFVFAFRDILSSVASYEVMSIYQPFKIGEWIQVGKCFGRVVDITRMDTVLMTPDNEMVYIPNSKITKSIVLNRTAPKETRISIPLTVENSLDLSEIERNLLEIADELQVELAPNCKPEVRVTKLDNQKVELALLLRVNNPAKSAFIASEVRKKAKTRLDQLRKKTSH